MPDRQCRDHRQSLDGTELAADPQRVQRIEQFGPQNLQACGVEASAHAVTVKLQERRSSDSPLSFSHLWRSLFKADVRRSQRYGRFRMLSARTVAIVRDGNPTAGTASASTATGGNVCPICAMLRESGRNPAPALRVTSTPASTPTIVAIRLDAATSPRWSRQALAGRQAHPARGFDDIVRDLPKAGAFGQPIEQDGNGRQLVALALDRLLAEHEPARH